MLLISAALGMKESKPSTFQFKSVSFATLMMTLRARVKTNWDRQKVQKLQLFLLFPLLWPTGVFHQKIVCLSVQYNLWL